MTAVMATVDEDWASGIMASPFSNAMFDLECDTDWSTDLSTVLEDDGSSDSEVEDFCGWEDDTLGDGILSLIATETPEQLMGLVADFTEAIPSVLSSSSCGQRFEMTTGSSRSSTCTTRVVPELAAVQFESEPRSTTISSSSPSADAQQWLADAHRAGKYRQSMPPAFAEQLLRDPSFQPGPRPRTFDRAATGTWVFKETIDVAQTARRRLHRSNHDSTGAGLLAPDRWHSSGGKKASRDLPTQAPLVRRRYGAIERKKSAMFTYHEYSLLDHNDFGISDGAHAEDRQVVLFHVLQKRPAVPAHSKPIRTTVSQPVEKSKSRASRKRGLKALEAIIAQPLKLQCNNTNVVISKASTKGKTKEPSATTPPNKAGPTTSVPGGRKRKRATGVLPAVTVTNPWSSDDESPATTPDEPGTALWRVAIRSEPVSSVIVSSSVSAEAQQWLAAAHAADNYRQSMPPAFAKQLLRDSTFQPGPRPRTFDAATTTGWVFKETIDTAQTVRQSRCNSDESVMPADRWHSSGGKKASRDLPTQVPLVRRRYGAIERTKVAMYAFNAYTSLVNKTDENDEEDRQVVLFHVLQRRKAKHTERSARAQTPPSAS